MTSWRAVAEPDFEDFLRLPLLLCGLGCHRNPYQLQGTPKKVLPWNAFPRSLCEAALSPWGILSDSLHGIKMRFPSMDKQDNMQEVTTWMGSAQGMALSAYGLLQLCWLLELSQVLANLGCITESTEHTAQSLGQPPSDMLVLSSLCSVPLAYTWVRWHHSASSLFSSRGPEALPELSATWG